MKTEFYTILLFLTALVLCSADGCDTVEEQQQNEFSARIDAITQSLESDVLSETAKLAYAQKAGQKLRDFGEYFSLYANTMADTAFRETALTLMRDLFFTDSTLIPIRIDTLGHVRQVALRNLSMALAQMPYESIWIDIDSLKVIAPLESVDASTFQGRLGYIEDWMGIADGDTVRLDRAPGTCDFYAAKEVKAIGMSRVAAWKVSLGQLRVINND